MIEWFPMTSSKSHRFPKEDSTLPWSRQILLQGNFFALLYTVFLLFIKKIILPPVVLLVVFLHGTQKWGVNVTEWNRSHHVSLLPPSYSCRSSNQFSSLCWITIVWDQDEEMFPKAILCYILFFRFLEMVAKRMILK